MSAVILSPLEHRKIWSKFSDRDYRQGYAEGHVGDFLASQINSMRSQRNLTQADLALKADVSQPQISTWETSCEGVRLTSLCKIAEAFDVALICKFVPFSSFVKEAIDHSADFNVPSFDDDSVVAISFSTISISTGTTKTTAKSSTEAGQRQSFKFATGHNIYMKEIRSA